jgi:IS30 family transposase
VNFRSGWINSNEHLYATVTDEQVKRVEKYLNDRPIRKFNYKTPKQVLLEKIVLIT